MTDAARAPGPSDAELIAAARAGSAQAYAALYQRHRGAAYNLARQLARSGAEADDLVADAFAKVLDTLRSGGGPDTAFRAYLLTAVRHCAYDRTRRDRRIELSDDVSAFDAHVPFIDTAVAGLERSLAARAFARLPQRWQMVLWHTEVEGATPAEIAPLLGLTPNGVSALAYRAREGLRQAYLQLHLADGAAAGRGSARCRAAVAKLGAWIRQGLSTRETAQVEQHLDECERCRALAVELADVNGGLRAFVAPLVLGPAATAYLAAAGTKAAAVTGATGAGAVAGSSGAQRSWLSVAASTVMLVAAAVVGLVTGSPEPATPRSQAVALAPPSRPPAVPPTAGPTPNPPPPSETQPTPSENQPTRSTPLPVMSAPATPPGRTARPVRTAPAGSSTTAPTTSAFPPPAQPSPNPLQAAAASQQTTTGPANAPLLRLRLRLRLRLAVLASVDLSVGARLPAARGQPTPSSRTITIRCTSEVPSPISRILASRQCLATG